MLKHCAYSYLFASLILFLISSCNSTDSNQDLSAPEIESFEVSSSNLAPGDTSQISASIMLDRQQPLFITYTFSTNGGTVRTERGGTQVVPGSGSIGMTSITLALKSPDSLAFYVAPEETGEYFVALTVTEELTPDKPATDTLTITVTE